MAGKGTKSDPVKDTKTKSTTTKKPTGLKIVRNKKKFTCSWKIADKDHEDGQDFYWYIKTSTTVTGKAGTYTKIGDLVIVPTALKVSKTATSKAFSFDDNFLKQLYPYTSSKLKTVLFGIQGNRKSYKEVYTVKKDNKTVYHERKVSPGPSGFATKEMDIDKPPKPSITVTRNSANKCTFAYSVNASDSDKKPFTWVEYQTAWTKDSASPSYGKVSHSTKTSGTLFNDSENSNLFTGEYSYTRWVRARSCGPGGASDWVEKKHVYAKPYAAIVHKDGTTFAGTGSNYTCRITWTSNSNGQHPIDSDGLIPRYQFAVPILMSNELRLPLVDEGSWTDLPVVSDTKDRDAIVFALPRQPNVDECLFVSVATRHDDVETYSNNVIPKGGVGDLMSSPSGIEIVEAVSSTGLIKLSSSLTDNSSIENSKLAVYFKKGTTDKGSKIVAILDPKLHPESEGYTFAVEPWGTSQYTIGVMAFAGPYSISSSDGDRKTYSITALMRSFIEWIVSPKIPTNVNLKSVGTLADKVQVTWEQDWTAADITEISWSDYEDAWDSTDQPSTFEVSSVRAGKMIITGLSVGTWYFRLRYGVSGAESVTWGEYTKTYSIDLAESPSTPVLTLEPANAVITETGNVKCTWAFVSNDGTKQSYAEIGEATINSSGVITGYNLLNPRAYTNTANSITVYAADQGWHEGETHHLCVKVTSTANKSSEEWSAPVSVSIVHKPTVSIDETSLTTIQIPADGEYIPTSDSAEATAVIEPDVSEISTYYEFIDNAYVRTTDVTIDPDKIYYQLSFDFGDKTYYTVAATTVVNPIDDNIDTYYELINGVYAKTADVYVDSTKTYYTCVFTAVASPTVDDLATYYEIPVRSQLSLTEMPLTATITGAGTSGSTTLIVERASAFLVDRPDETEYDGFEGETIVMVSQSGEDAEKEISVDNGSPALIGRFDDTAQYRLIAMVTDSYGQTVESDPVEFEVHWAHQAQAPTAIMELRQDLLVTFITPQAPQAVADGDVCDIYRLSLDKPVLIYSGAVFGKRYVDPYPTLGEFGGHRIVYRTKNGDYTLNNGHLAWLDYPTEEDPESFDEFTVLIDFGGQQVSLPYNVDLSHSWSKDFTETKYLGGAVRGDWNPAVSRTSSINTAVAVEYDSDKIEMLRRLAVYPGICHVRTPDGSSFAADVQVSESREERWVSQLATFSLNITRVDPEGLDGLTYDEWRSRYTEEDTEE